MDEGGSYIATCNEQSGITITEYSGLYCDISVTETDSVFDASSGEICFDVECPTPAAVIDDFSTVLEKYGFNNEKPIYTKNKPNYYYRWIQQHNFIFITLANILISVGLICIGICIYRKCSRKSNRYSKVYDCDTDEASDYEQQAKALKV